MLLARLVPVRSNGQAVKRPSGQAVKRSSGQAVKRSSGQAVKRSSGQSPTTRRRPSSTPLVRVGRRAGNSARGGAVWAWGSAGVFVSACAEQGTCLPPGALQPPRARDDEKGTCTVKGVGAVAPTTPHAHKDQRRVNNKAARLVARIVSLPTKALGSLHPPRALKDSKG